MSVTSRVEGMLYALNDVDYVDCNVFLNYDFSY